MLKYSFAHENDYFYLEERRMNEIDRDPVGPAEPVEERPVPPGPARSLPDADSAPKWETARPSIVTLLVNPRTFFEALERGEVSLLVPALIVLAVGAVGAVAAYQISAVLMDAMRIPGVEGIGGVIGIIGAISALLGTLFFWVIYSAVFFIISMAFNGRGDFTRLLAYVGYGHLPQVIGGLVSTVLTWNYLSNLRIPPLTTPEAIQEWTTSLVQAPTMQLAAIVGLLFLLWSANIWIFGVRTGRKLSTRDAAITVLVPVVLYILYTLYTLVG